MLRFLISLFLISEAQQKNDAALINGVRQTLDVCSDIVEAVGDFLSIFETDRRRDSLGVAVAKKLKVCRKLVELVDNFRQDRSSMTKRVGTIRLSNAESEFLDKQLKITSMKLGETLYIASEDGDAAADFHRKCDNQGSTVVIVETKAGAVFGGYTTANWNARIKGHKESKTAFLFSLRPSMKKYAIRKNRTKYAIMTNPDDGPSFGFYSRDLYIRTAALRPGTKGSTMAGETYQFPKPRYDYSLNEGKRLFEVKDYVVIKAIKL